MENQLPDQFDIIIIGTGMVESIVSAAASRIGKKVLHIDKNKYYGGQWTSLSLEAINKLQHKTAKTYENVLEEKTSHIGNNLFDIENFNVYWHISSDNLLEDQNDNKSQKTNEKPKIENEGLEIKTDKEKFKGWTQEKLLNESRRFNIDLVPKLQFARGDFVELLISSNIARYSEYRSVSRVLVWLNGQLKSVPCSRSDVFASSNVSVIEKRMLMKLLTSLDDCSEELKNYENKTFRQFLKDRKLTPNLIHYVLYAISMSNDQTPCYKGIQNTKRFLKSLGRFGKTPFLFSMYGSGEVTQAFCRLSAVFGGLFALAQPLKSLSINENKFQSLIVGNQEIKSHHVVMSIEKSPKNLVESIKKTFINRAVLITDRSVMESEKEHLTLLLHPLEDGKNLVTIIEMGSLTGTCPKNVYLVHLISTKTASPEEDFKHIVDKLFDATDDNSGKPKILWSCYFTLPDTSKADLRENVPPNVYLCPGPDSDLDYDTSIVKAKEIFHEIYPDNEFLPRAPDPEEIVIEGENEDTKPEKQAGK